jgi:hypothetical protein
MIERYRFTFEYKTGDSGRYVYSSCKDPDKVAALNNISLEEMEVIHIRDNVQGVTIFDPFKGIYNA